MRLYLDLADNLMVRDGRPFNQDDAGQARSASRFPPPPDTVYGAVRVALARAMGWSGVGDWTTDDGGGARRDALGGWGETGEQAASLAVAGPFFEVNDTPLLPIPGHICARVDKAAGTVVAISALSPSERPMVTDQGEVRQLELPSHSDGVSDELLGGRWAPQAEVLRLLAEGPMTSVQRQLEALAVPHSGPRPRVAKSRMLNAAVALPGVATDSLGSIEARVGLERHTDTRQAVEGKLYASTRRVLPPGVRLFVDVRGVDVGLSTAPVPIGGEGRFAFPEAGANRGVDQQVVPDAQYLVALMTPAILPELVIGQPVPGLPGNLVGAVVSGITSTAGFERSDAQVRKLTASRAVIKSVAGSF